MDDKVYIFVSHSHFDIDKVRVIRNYLEDIGCEPILFFLKSKTDKNEITQLIKDEIDARLWFIYCQSENSENSNWVATELKYIEETNKKNNFTIELNTSFDENGELNDAIKLKIKNHLNIIKKNQTVFISYSQKDVLLVDKIKEYMNKYGICFNEYSNTPIGNLFTQIVDDVNSSDYFLIIVTENSINSKWVENELAFAHRKRKKILPVCVDYKISYNDNFSFYLESFSFYNFDSNNIAKSCNELMYHLISLQE